MKPKTSKPGKRGVSRSIDLGGFKLTPAEIILVRAIVKWINTIMILLNKDRKIRSDDIKTMFTDALRLACDYQHAEGITDSMLLKHEKQLLDLTEILFGVMNLCKENYHGMKSLCMKIGGFGSTSQIDEMISILNKYKRFLSGFDHAGTKILQSVKEEATNQAMTLIAGGKSWDPSELFMMFDKDKSGFITINEFNEILKYMGLFLSREKLVKLYSEADRDHSKTIDFEEFSRVLKQLKRMIAK